jgi:aromatic ring-opening dioxygenase catalytic subunit (LigB family)
MPMTRFPTFFLSHGGGPWPFMDERREQYATTAKEFSRLPQRLPSRPKAVLVITGHWEAPEFTVSTSAHPPMVYDYYGFPEHTYHLKYPAPGLPSLAAKVKELLGREGIACGEDANQGFDHGTFVPLGLMYPNADMPIVLLSLKSTYDPAEHLRVGEAIASLRGEGILIIGSGLTYHNMRGFGRPESTDLLRLRILSERRREPERSEAAQRDADRMAERSCRSPGPSAGRPSASPDGCSRCRRRRHRPPHLCRRSRKRRNGVVRVRRLEYPLIKLQSRTNAFDRTSQLRGAKATKQSRLYPRRKSGLLRLRSQ